MYRKYAKMRLLDKKEKYGKGTLDTKDVSRR